MNPVVIAVIAAIVLMRRNSAPAAQYVPMGVAPGTYVLNGEVSTNAPNEQNNGGPDVAGMFLSTETGQAAYDEFELKKKQAEAVVQAAKEGGQKAATAVDHGLAWLVRTAIY